MDDGAGARAPEVARLARPHALLTALVAALSDPPRSQTSTRFRSGARPGRNCSTDDTPPTTTATVNVKRVNGRGADMRPPQSLTTSAAHQVVSFTSSPGRSPGSILLQFAAWSGAVVVARRGGPRELGGVDGALLSRTTRMGGGLCRSPAQVCKSSRPQGARRLADIASNGALRTNGNPVVTGIACCVTATRSCARLRPLIFRDERAGGRSRAAHGRDRCGRPGAGAARRVHAKGGAGRAEHAAATPRAFLRRASACGATRERRRAGREGRAPPTPAAGSGEMTTAPRSDARPVPSRRSTRRIRNCYQACAYGSEGRAPPPRHRCALERS